MYNHNILRARIKYLCDLKKIALRKLLSDLGYNVNMLTQVTGERGISSVALCAIADYLDCSLDYLTGRCDNPNQHKL